MIRQHFSVFAARIIFIIIILITIGSCTSKVETIPEFRERLAEGDHAVSWAVTYLDSWRRDRQPRYLYLAETQIMEAIQVFFQLQHDTSPRIKAFYVVRDRRSRSCRFLVELQFEAQSFGVNMSQDPVDPCIF